MQGKGDTGKHCRGKKIDAMWMRRGETGKWWGDESQACEGEKKSSTWWGEERHASDRGRRDT